MRRREKQNPSMGMETSKSTFAKLWSVFTWLLVGIIVLLAVALVGVRLLGFQPFAVLSPSMTPKYEVGDLVYVLPTDPEKIEVGDVLTFIANAEGVVVTHRVVEMDRENGCFYTKGDANDSRDGSPVVYECGGCGEVFSARTGLCVILSFQRFRAICGDRGGAGSNPAGDPVGAVSLCWKRTEGREWGTIGRLAESKMKAGSNA